MKRQPCRHAGRRVPRPERLPPRARAAAAGRAPNELVIEIAACGICASDCKCQSGAKMFWGGNAARWVKAPVIPGHEFFGYVDELGDGRGRALRRRAGRPRDRRADRAVRQVPLLHDPASTGCARCTTSSASSARSPTAAWPSTCAFRRPRACTRFPSGMSLEDAAIIEPLACAIHTVNRGDIQLDDVRRDRRRRPARPDDGAGRAAEDAEEAGRDRPRAASAWRWRSASAPT